MKIRVATFAALCVAIEFIHAGAVAAQDVSRALLCEKIDGRGRSVGFFSCC